MRFVSGDSLREAFDELRKSKRLWCAVAFWGAGAANQFLANSAEADDRRFICNLAMGGTNPHEIERLLKAGAQVRQDDVLHAKVYLGDREMLVASANASANGLGFEAAEVGGWVEAAMFGCLQPDAVHWFESRWAVSRLITADDLAMAQRRWRERRTRRPSMQQFRFFDPIAENLPLIEWVSNTRWKANESHLRAEYGTAAEEILRSIEDAVDVHGAEDEAALGNGRWILRWSRTARGAVHRHERLEWVHAGPTTIKAAYSYEDASDEHIDVRLPSETPPPQPFDPNEPAFRSAFTQVIQRPAFELLTQNDYEGCWFTKPRVDVLPEFWSAVKTEYEAAGQHQSVRTSGSA